MKYIIYELREWFKSYIINTHFFHGNIWTHNWLAPNVSGFIAQSVEHRTGKSRGHGFKPRWSPEFFSGFFTQLHKLRSLRRSFLHFHFISAVHLWFVSYIINTHFFHGNIWTHNWPAPNVSGFIAQLAEHRTGIARSRVQTPLKSWIFFQASLRNYANCVHCDDHFFISTEYDVGAIVWKLV